MIPKLPSEPTKICFKSKPVLSFLMVDMESRMVPSGRTCKDVAHSIVKLS